MKSGVDAKPLSTEYSMLSYSQPKKHLNNVGQVSDLLLQYLDDLYMKRANAMECALVSYPRSRKFSISTHALKFSLYVLLCTVLL